MTTIGIKIANGKFYSILEENSCEKKNIILTTAHDNQHSVQIDLYKSYSKTMAEAFHIGSLIVQNIKPEPRGKPSIEFIIISDQDGNINVEVRDLHPDASKESQYLNINLKSLNTNDKELEINDFELGNSALQVELFEKPSSKTKKKKVLLPLLLILLPVLALLGYILWFFLTPKVLETNNAPITQNIQEPELRTAAETPRNPLIPPQSTQTQPAEVSQNPVTTAQNPETSSQSPVTTAQNPVATTQNTVTQELQEPVVQTNLPIQTEATQPSIVQTSAPATSSRRPFPPVSSYRVPSTIPREGVPYRIRFGDTLWDIAEAFYHNPWLYPRIANFNNIRNPDRIISGTVIRIPPRN